MVQKWTVIKKSLHCRSIMWCRDKICYDFFFFFLSFFFFLVFFFFTIFLPLFAFQVFILQTSLFSPCTQTCFCSREESSQAALELLHHLFLSSLFKMPDQKPVNRVVFWTEVRILRPLLLCLTFFVLLICLL